MLKVLGLCRGALHSLQCREKRESWKKQLSLADDPCDQPRSSCTGDTAWERQLRSPIQGTSQCRRWVTALSFSHFFPNFSMHVKLEKTGTTLFFRAFTVCFNQFGKNCNISSTTAFSYGR